jgi:hypothetical protein
MGTSVRAVIIVAACVAVFAAAGFAARIEAVVVTQLACPVRVTKITACYGPAGMKYKPADYAHINPEGAEKLWVFAVFQNAGDDPVTSFDFDVLVWDATGNELFREEGIFDFPLRDDPRSKEWSWEFEGAGLAATVVFVPRIVTYPASRKWIADEKFVEGKIEELRNPSE